VLVADGEAAALLLPVSEELAEELADADAGADVLDVAGAAGVTAGRSTWPLVWTGVGIAVGSCDAVAAAADAEPFDVGPSHWRPPEVR
jgi:hypothetical protein